MIRIQTTYNLGCEQVERVVEVDDISALSTEERELLIDTATGPLSYVREEADEPDTVKPGLCASLIHSLNQIAGEIHPVDGRDNTSHIQALVNLGLFQKDFIIRHKLEALRILHGGESFRMQQSLLVKSLMHDLDVDTEECGTNMSESS